MSTQTVPTTAASIPTVGPTANPATLTIAAVGDLHCTRHSEGALQPYLAQLGSRADVLLLCGDLTDYGAADEARILARELSRSVNVPMLAVLGNHDFHSGHEAEVTQILSDAGVNVLDGDAVQIKDVGFVGVKGFCGGFGRRTLEPWGEVAIKDFVRQALDEALKLESGLAKLRTATRVAFMHYAPVAGTVDGEPLEIYPFLGSSRLEEPLNRYGVAAVFHGHAHRGSPEGTLRDGTPVYNVAAPLLRRLYPAEPPFKFLTIPVEVTVDDRETHTHGPA